MKNDSPRRKKKRLNSLFEGMETKVQIKKSERENTTGSTSKGKTAADLRATKLAQAKRQVSLDVTCLAILCLLPFEMHLLVLVLYLVSARCLHALKK